MLAHLSKDEVTRQGMAFYEEKIRPLVEAENIGKYIVLDLETGGYEIDTDEISLMQRAMRRFPNGTLFALRIGYRAMGKIGGTWERLRQ